LDDHAVVVLDGSSLGDRGIGAFLLSSLLATSGTHDIAIGLTAPVTAKRIITVAFAIVGVMTVVMAVVMTGVMDPIVGTVRTPDFDRGAATGTAGPGTSRTAALFVP
jgi:hypothetical protein